MRILLTNHFPFHGAGTGLSTYDLALGLRAAGHEVRALIVDHQRESPEPFPVCRIVCREGDPDADLPFDLPSFTTHPESHITFHDLTDEQIADYREVMRQAIDAEVEDFDPQIIHCRHIWLQGALVLETGVPYVLCAQGPNLLAYQRDSRYHLWAEQAAENAGRIMADTRIMQQAVCETFDADAKRVMLIPSAIDLRPYQTSKTTRPEMFERLDLQDTGGPIVVFGGKLVADQGPDILLAAAKIYQRELPEVMTILAGDGPLCAELKKQVEVLGLQHTYLLGDRARIDQAALYRMADVKVVPARTEPFEMVVLEALASGTPVIGSRVGGLPEIIPEELGGLIEPDDPAELAETVVRAVREDWKRSKGAACAAHAAREHGMDVWVNRVEGVYHTVLKERFA